MAIQLSSDDLRSLAILSAAGMGLSAIPTRGGTGSSRTASILSAISGEGEEATTFDPSLRRYEAEDYPTRFTPGTYHTYDVAYFPGPANNNVYGQMYEKLIKDAGRMQTLDEHNAALMKYVRPGMTPKALHMAIAMGEEEEKKLPQFWDESSDVGNDRAKFNVSSSAVSGIRLTPDARVEVRWGTSPKWYTFQQYENTHEASKAAQKLLTAPSIGRAVYPIVSRKIKNPKNGLGKWNFDNYDPAMV